MIKVLMDILLLVAFLGIIWLVYKCLLFLSFSKTCIQRMVVLVSGHLKAILMFLYQWFQKILSFIKQFISNITMNVRRWFQLKCEVEVILKEDSKILQT